MNSRTFQLGFISWCLLLTGAFLAWFGTRYFFLGSPEDFNELVRAHFWQALLGRPLIGLVFASPVLAFIGVLAAVQVWRKEPLLISGFPLPFGWVLLLMWLAAAALGSWQFVRA